MATIENGRSSADNLKEISWVKENTKKELAAVKTEVTSLDGIFGIIDKVTDGIVIASDGFIQGSVDLISRIFNRKKKEEEDIDG